MNRDATLILDLLCDCRDILILRKEDSPES